MCQTFHSYQPVCHCIKVEAVVALCLPYSGLPENKDKPKFNAKLVTGHSKGLDHLFNGVNYMSVDRASDLAPEGLDCDDIEWCESPSKRGPCPLCDNPEVLKFLKAKGIEYDPVANLALSDRQDEVAEGSAKDTGESSRGRPLKASGDKSLDKLAGSSDAMEGLEYDASQARGREGPRAEGKGAEGKRAVSEPDESKLASMDWE